jgi:hypothetical protein
LEYSLLTLFLYIKYKIIKNNLRKKAKILKGYFDTRIQIGADIYVVKFAFFSHTSINCCNIYCNDKKIAIVKKKYWDFPPHKFEVEFNVNDDEKELYSLIVLSISLSLFDDL